MSTGFPPADAAKALHFGTTRVLRWGNGLGVRIPLPLARKAGLREGSVVELSSEGGRIALQPLPTARTLQRLLAEITPDNLPRDLGWWRESDEEESAP